jgi:hypothetical protein
MFNLKRGINFISDLLSMDKSSRNFKKYLSENPKLSITNPKSSILIEFEQSPENVLALSIFLPVLLETLNSKLIAFQITKREKISMCFKWIRYRFSTTFKLVGSSLIFVDYSSSETDYSKQSI